MKKLLLSGAALIALTVTASAADLPSRKMAPIAPAYVPVFTWTGFYVGVNAGYAFSDSGSDDGVFVGNTFFPGSSKGNRDGFAGGGQVGYNYQFGQFVVGVETDIQYADLKGDNNSGVGAIVAPGVYVSGGQGLEYFGTVRARAGFAFDRALIYATGGFAYGGGGGNNNYYGFVNNGGDDVKGGYTVGGGVEYAFTNNLTAKLEGLYVNIDRGSNAGYVVTPAGVATAVYGTKNDDNGFGVVRAGLNYKF